MPSKKFKIYTKNNNNNKKKNSWTNFLWLNWASKSVPFSYVLKKKVLFCDMISKYEIYGTYEVNMCMKIKNIEFIYRTGKSSIDKV
jgi:hypothetical protein